jgi:succinate dehydrogenase / fumarate reductase cytochrome b subunit
MNWVVRALHSSIGAKVVTAITGIGLMVFLIGHLSGNLLMFKGPDAINAYAKMLHDLGPLLWVARLGLLATVALHIYLSVSLQVRNMEARPVPYVFKQYAAATFASRTMLATGLLIAAFVLFHLAHFTLGLVDPETFAGNNFEKLKTAAGTLAVADPLHPMPGRPDVYTMVVKGFSNPFVSAGYILMMCAVGLHLSHGASSVFQTLGLNHRKYNPLIRNLGPVFAAVLAAGYISIPVAVMIGLIK